MIEDVLCEVRARFKLNELNAIIQAESTLYSNEYELEDMILPLLMQVSSTAAGLCTMLQKHLYTKGFERAYLDCYRIEMINKEGFDEFFQSI